MKISNCAFQCDHYYYHYHCFEFDGHLFIIWNYSVLSNDRVFFLYFCLFAFNLLDYFLSLEL